MKTRQNQSKSATQARSASVMITFAAFFLINLAVPAQEICGSVFTNERLSESHPGADSIFRSQERIHAYTGEIKGVVTIPVVFHVIYNHPAQQLPASLFNQAIDILTKDFRRKNPDAVNTGKFGGYQNPNGLWQLNYNNIAADCEIEFELCDVTYDYSQYIAFDVSQNPNFIKTLFPYYQQYNPTKFLNVWICSITGNLMGMATFPGNAPQTDGIVLSNSTVGYGSNNFRVLTHEVGHWLGLRHIWGDCTCCDDYVTDTYPQQNNNIIMASQPPLPNYPNQAPCAMWTACPGINVHANYYYPYVNMGDNFMDYSPSQCLNFFSQGQKQRMWYYLNYFRTSLLNNNSCSAATTLSLPGEPVLSISPNPVADVIYIANIKPGVILTITNLLGEKILEAEAESNGAKLDVSRLPAGVYFLNKTKFIKM